MNVKIVLFQALPYGIHTCVIFLKSYDKFSVFVAEAELQSPEDKPCLICDFVDLIHKHEVLRIIQEARLASLYLFAR